MDTEYQDLIAMNKKFSILHADHPGHLSHRKMLERIGCMQEELSELANAASHDDLAGVADALVDLVVFAKGTAVMLGLPWQELWDDVMRANMAKERGVGKRGHAVDLVKTEGWVGPRTGKVLEAVGYDVDAWVNTDGLIDGRDDDSVALADEEMVYEAKR